MYRIVIVPIFLILPLISLAQLSLQSPQIMLPGIVHDVIPADSVFQNKKTTTPDLHGSIMHVHPQLLPKPEPRHFGVFCKIESRIAKNSVLAPRFRLGTAAYVDWLEGKRNRQ